MKPNTRIAEQRAKMMKKKEDTIQTVLDSARNNPKFIKLLVYSLNSLENFITPPNREIRVNAKIIIKREGVGILRALALVNITNEQIVTQTGDIIWKLLSIYDVVDQELAKLFAEKNGQNDVIEIMLRKDKDSGSSACLTPYVKVLNGLAQVPQLVGKLLDSGLAETIKLMNDMYADDINIIKLNFDTLKKLSNQKTGRDFIIEKGLVPSIINNVKKCADHENPEAVLSGFAVLDNLSRNDNGKEAIKNENAVEVISDVLNVFDNDDRVLKMGAKIFSKISTEQDMRDLLKKVDEKNKTISENPEQDDLKELEKILVLVSNLMLVEDIGRVACEDENFKMLSDLFRKIQKIDLTGKSPEYIKTYTILDKYFMVVFSRIFHYLPEVYDKETDKGKETADLINLIQNSVQKVYEADKANVEKLETEGDANNYAPELTKAFRDYFSSYDDHLLEPGKAAKNGQYEDNLIKMLEYVVNNIITNGKKFFDVDERANFAASKLLKLADEIVQKHPTASTVLPTSLPETFQYMKNVVNISENVKTLSNDLDVVKDLITGEETEKKKKTKEDIIPVAVHFMEKKPKYRYPNKVNLDILDIYLTPNFISEMQANPDPKINPNFELNYVGAIISVLSKAFFESSTVLKVVGGTENKEVGFDGNTEGPGELDEELEKKIIDKGSELLLRLVSPEEFTKQLKLFRSNASSFKPGSSSVDEILALENNLLYQHCLINGKQFYDLGAAEDLDILKDLIKKEISYIEAFKRDKANENNPKYGEITDASTKRLKMQLGLLKKIDDNAIKHYTETKDPKYLDILKGVTQLNLDIYDKSTDSKNLVDQLTQLRKDIPFIKENEEALKTGKPGEGSALERYINSIMKLFGKSVDEEELVDGIIKTLIFLVTKKPESCNLLVKAGCPRLLLTVMENTQNNKLANNALELLKMITLSNEENLIMVANQNILGKLFEIRAKFASDEKITKGCDQIANEIMKLPGQEDAAAEVVRDAIAEFHENIKGDFKDAEVKQKILGNLETINAFTSNKKIVEASLMTDEFNADLDKAIELTNQDPEVSQTNEKLLTNEIAILKKIRDCLPNTEENVPKHDKISTNVLGVINQKSNYADSLLATTKMLGDYVKDEDLYKKCLDSKIDEKFIDHLFDINENYLDNPEVSKEINNILCYLCLRNQKLADYIVSKGGLANVIEELKATVNLNDEASKQLKSNGLKMLDSLLNDEKNLDFFVKARGVELLNNIVKNEVTIAPEVKDNDSLFKTRETINTKTPEQLAEEAKLSTSDQAQKEPEKEENKGDNYFVSCLKIMKKGLEHGKKEFVDDKAIKNIAMLAEANYPDKFLFNELANILSNDGVTLPESPEDNQALIRLGLSNKAKYYGDRTVADKVKAIEDRLAAQTLKPEPYKSGLKKAIKETIDKNDPKDLNRLLTYTALATEMKDFDEVAEADKDDLMELYNHAMNQYKKADDAVNPNVDEGVVLALMKLTNFLLEKGYLPKDSNEKLDTIIGMAMPLYKPENYVFVDQYNKEMDKLLDKYGKVDESKSDPEHDRYKYTDANLNNLQNSFNKAIPFLADYHKDFKSAPLGTYPEVAPEKESNLDKIIDNTNDYYKTEEDSNFKAPLGKPICDAVLDIVDDLKQDGVVKKDDEAKTKQLNDRLLKLWNVVKNSLAQDVSNTIPLNEDTVGNIVEKINDTIGLGANEPSLRDVPKIISGKIENNDDANDKILTFAADDLLKNAEEEGKENPEIKAKDLETLANLSKYQGPMKSIMKNEPLWNLLKKYYEKDDKMENRAALSEIFRNATKNNFNIENLISSDPDAIKLILNKVMTDTIKSDENKGFEVAATEVDSVCDVLKDTNNFKTMQEKKIIGDDDLKKLEDAYKEINPELASKIKPLLDQIAEANKSQQEAKNFQNDEELLKNLTHTVEEAFKEHMTELENFGTEGDKDISKGTKMITTESNIVQSASSIRKGRLSIITQTLLFNPNNDKVKSLLSVKNNLDMPTTLEQIISLMRKLYNESKTSEDQELNKKRVVCINECLRLLKSLSLAPDNHKPILEVGLINFMEKLSTDDKAPIGYSVGSKDVLKNCSNSDNAVPVIIDSPILDNLINEVLNLYENPDVLATNPDMRTIFLADNITFSNVCKNKKGFEAVFKKIGLEKLLDLGKKTGNVDLLEAIINMLINYLRHTDKETLEDSFWNDVIVIVNKCLNLKDRTPSLIAKTQTLISLMYMDKLIPLIEKLDLINHMNYDFQKFKDEKEYLNSTLNCLSVITNGNSKNSKECVESGLVTKLKDEVSKLNSNDNEDMILNLTGLYDSLVLNNMENVDAFCKLGITDNTVYWLEQFAPRVSSARTDFAKSLSHATVNLDALGGPAEAKETSAPFKKLLSSNIENAPFMRRLSGNVGQAILLKAASGLIGNESSQYTSTLSAFLEASKKDNSQLVKGILQNSISTLDSITISKEANDYLCKGSFAKIVSESLKNKGNEIGYITTALHSIGNYLYEGGDEVQTLNLEELYQLLKGLQQEYYSNSDILTNINYICGSLTKNVKDSNYVKKFFDLITESTKCQDWNVQLIVMALKLMYEALVKNKFLIDEVFDDTVPNIYNLLKLYKDNVDIQENCYKILSLFGENNVYGYSMVNSGLMDIIKETLDNQNLATNKKAKAKIRAVVFSLLEQLSADEANSKKISDDLMVPLLKEISEEGYTEETMPSIRLLSKLLKHKYCIQPFIQYKGLEEAVKLLKDNDSNVELILDLFHMLTSIANAGDEYKFMMQQLRLPDLINQIIRKSGMYEKKIEYEGRSLIFLINMAKVKLEAVDDIDFSDIKIVNPIKPEIKNFLTSGKQLKIINNNGDVKQMQLMFSQDLLKISAKKLKSTLPPKPKYVIETAQIKQIVKGHGTDAFKKSKGLFRSIPKPEVCFSIIGPTTIDGVKSINVQCETEADVDKWIKYMEIVINHFKKTKTIKSAVVIKK